jgi:hypothetical protein
VLAERPLALERLVVALHLAVGLGPADLDEEVADAVCAEQFAQAVVARVGEVVVAHQPLDLDPVGGEEDECALGEGGDAGGALVRVELGVGEPGVVVDHRVGELPADG